MFICHDQKWIQIAIPKTASKSISRALGHTQHPEPEIYHATINDIVTAHPETMNYAYWFIVRNPFSRLVSSYFDFTLKRKHAYSAQKVFDKPLLSEFENFEDFCLRLGDSHWKDDIFFKPQVSFITRPSHSKSRFIAGKYEHLADDFNIICDIFKIKCNRSLVHENQGRYDKDWRDYYKSNEQITAIENLYKDDLREFHYAF